MWEQIIGGENEHIYVHLKDNETHLGEHINVRQLKPQHDHEGQQSGRDEHRRISAVMHQARTYCTTYQARGQTEKESEASEKNHKSRHPYIRTHIHIVCVRNIILIFPVFGDVTSCSHEH